jgi:hypothetical protein
MKVSAPSTRRGMRVTTQRSMSAAKSRKTFAPPMT